MVAGLINALMKLIGVEELALVLSRIRVISSNEDGRNGAHECRSSRDLIIDA